jgi:hypothetical protein
MHRLASLVTPTCMDRHSGGCSLNYITRSQDPRGVTRSLHSFVALHNDGLEASSKRPCMQGHTACTSRGAGMHAWHEKDNEERKRWMDGTRAGEEEAWCSHHMCIIKSGKSVPQVSIYPIYIYLSLPIIHHLPFLHFFDDQRPAQRNLRVVRSLWLHQTPSPPPGVPPRRTKTILTCSSLWSLPDGLFVMVCINWIFICPFHFHPLPFTPPSTS